MAAILLPRSAATRPFRPILNRDTAQARGLQRLWPLNAGGRLQDLVSRSHLTINPTSTFQWGAHPVLGSSLYLPSGGGTASMLISGLANVPAPWTFSFWWHRIAGPSTVHVVTSAPGSTNGVRGEQFNNTKALGYTAAGTDRSSGIVASATQAQCITYVQPAGAGVDMTLYVDGVARATMATSGADLTLSRIGNYADAVSLPIYGWYGHIGVWNYAMPADLVSALYDAETRWDLYWQPTRAFLFVGAAGGGTAHEFDAQPGSVALTGVQAQTMAVRALDGQPGSYSLTGILAGLAFQPALNAAPGAVALTGVAATLPAVRLLDGQPGAVSLTGVLAGLSWGPALNAAPGAVTLTGIAATLPWSAVLSASPAAYTLTGIDATLEDDAGGAVAYELDAQPGAIAVTGAAAGLAWGPVVNGQPGALTLTGIAAGVAFAAALAAVPGAYTLTGVAATVPAVLLLSAEPGVWTLTGVAAGLDSSADVTPEWLALADVAVTFSALSGLAVTVPLLTSPDIVTPED